METNKNLDFHKIEPLGNNYLKCEKCNYTPEFTIFNSSNSIKIYSECKNKHINIFLLDEYIKKIISNNKISKCEKCKQEKNIKICQFCNKYLCEKCNNNHLTIEHIINNKISNDIYENKYLNNIDDKFKIIKEKILNTIKYLKDIIEYYKILENNFKKFLIDNLNEIILNY